jgi:hypothetical protein
VKLVTIKFRMPEGGSRKVNRFLQKTIECVSGELLMSETEAPCRFPLFDAGTEVGEVEIEEVDK